MEAGRPVFHDGLRVSVVVVGSNYTEVGGDSNSDTMESTVPIRGR